MTYRLGVAYQLQYREDIDRDSRPHNLDTSIDCFEKANVLFREMKNLVGKDNVCAGDEVCIAW